MNNKNVMVEVSARHIHLTQKDYNFLFGVDCEYKKIKELSQKGEFTSDKKVSIVGPDSSLEARFLGPFRDITQVELSTTDCLTIGIKAPCEVDATDNAAEIKIVGSYGEINRKAAIIPRRHLHCNPSEADDNNLKSGQEVSVIIKTDRGEVEYGNIVVRIADNYQMSIHLDTDEGNAAGINKQTEGILITEK